MSVSHWCGLATRAIFNRQTWRAHSYATYSTFRLSETDNALGATTSSDEVGAAGELWVVGCAAVDAGSVGAALHQASDVAVLHPLPAGPALDADRHCIVFAPESSLLDILDVHPGVTMVR
jgi:hypothetical protein